MADPVRVLVLAPNWLGDAVMALPALADVRRRFPEHRMIVAARGPLARLFALVPAVDEIVELEWSGDVRAPGAFWRDAGRLRRARPLVALVLPNSFASGLLAWRSGARERLGYSTDGRAFLLTRCAERPRGSMHQAAYYQRLTTTFDVPAGPLEPYVVVPEPVRAEADAVLRQAGRDESRSLVVLAPGAAYGTAKRWWPQHFARLASDLVSQCRAQCVLVGSGADAATVAEVLAAVPATQRHDVLDICGRTSLETLAGVLASAQACVSNDSGAMHLAAAVGVPLAAVFGPTNERETAPLARAGTPVHLLINPVACRPCMLRECPIDHPCMRDLAPERAFEAVAGLLEKWGRESFEEDTRRP